ncbi:tRNA (guanine-N7-)-methyltransferase [Chitinivorax tropicus]|uniref:tRNA (guanine-N(7)-)-methyltransferase n=1 Tax=Chitinivorax tropicus TaxID=714531 RepID=A0A840MJP6_9PROT|nr:tRNA (guanosine(46)-N7)-methyltransferase TrmB [Chitinivorax tropicus]MBB5016786.1 tRNA (guanine-N7-)-methyltransferase [Chitinivorax tropicus]
MSDDVYTNPDDPKLRPIRSFVLRQGHLSTAQQRAIDEGMPRWGVPYQAQPLDLDEVFGRTAPKVLEIGFGMGGATADIAQTMPDVDFLGIEVHGPGVGNMLKLIAERNITNIRVMRHDAVEVMDHMLADGVLDGFHLFFPDPWHKKRHNKRRLVQPAFVEKIVKKLKPGGYIHMATDWEDYAIQMLEVLSANGELINTASGYADKPRYRPQTKFEARGLKLGHGVWDLVFRRRSA